MFYHQHPYPPFIKDDSTKLIVGTLPPPRFSSGDLYEKDVDFCYGSYFNSLWLYIDKIFDLNLRYDHSEEAITQRKDFLIRRKIGICDIVDSCEREQFNASDLEMKNIKLRDLVGYLRKFPKVDTLLFIGGNSKNGPAYFFKRHLNSYGMKLELVSAETPRINQFQLDDKTIKTVSLTSSSGAANISIGSSSEFKRLKAANPDFSVFDFRVLQYSEYF